MPPARKVAQILRQCFDRRVAALGLALQGLNHDRIQVAAQLDPGYGGAGVLARPRPLLGAIGLLLALLAVHRASHHGWPSRPVPVAAVPGHELNRKTAQAVDIRRPADRFAAQLLRCRVPRASVARYARCRFPSRGNLSRRRRPLRDAEVEQFYLAFFGDQHVGRLYVQMDDQLPMRELQRTAHLQCAFDSCLQSKLAFFTVLNQRRALDVFHDEVRTAVFRQAAVEQASNIRMRQTRENLPLAHRSAQLRLRCPCRA